MKTLSFCVVVGVVLTLGLLLDFEQQLMDEVRTCGTCVEPVDTVLTTTELKVDSRLAIGFALTMSDAAVPPDRGRKRQCDSASAGKEDGGRRPGIPPHGLSAVAGFQSYGERGCPRVPRS